MFHGKPLIVTGLKVFEADYQCSSMHVEPRGFSSLTYRISGRITLKSGETALISDQNTVTYVPKGVGYYTEILSPGRMIGIHFESAEAGEDLPEVVESANNIIIRNKFYNLLHTYSEGEQGRYAIMAQLYGIIAQLSQETGGETCAASFMKIRAACDYMNGHISDPNLTVSALASIAGMSEVHFRKLFFRVYASSPSVYIKKKRLDSAKALLETGYYMVSEVAARCGFQDAGYFSYEFRRAEGMTPTQYAEGCAL